MITKNDWDAAAGAAIAAERDRLGGPPSAEEVVDYLEGRLSPTESERVRLLLVYYPELTNLLREPRKRNHWRFAGRIAASVLIAIGALYALVLQRNIRHLEREAAMPQVVGPAHTLNAHHPRNARAPQQPYELPAGETVHRLAPAVIGEFAEYRLDLIDVNGEEPKTVWRAERVRRAQGEPLEILVPRAFLHKSNYRLDVYGITGSRTELLERFPLRVTH